LLNREFKKVSDEKIIAVLPGSRTGEIKYNLPEIIKTCRIIRKQSKVRTRFIIPVASTLNADDIRCFFNKGDEQLFEIVHNRTYDIYSISDYALVASGTATVECALFEIPMTIVYKVSSLSAFLFRNFVKYKKPIGMVNLLLDEVVCHEFFQENAVSENIAGDVLENLDGNNPVIKEKLKKVRQLLYTGNSPSANAAKIIMRYM
jgi:lipid A disaccharide synthetase